MAYFKKKWRPPVVRPKTKADEVLALRKNMRGEAVYAREGSDVPYVQTGRYLDQEEFDRTVESFLAELLRVSGKKWKVVSKKLEPIYGGSAENGAQEA
jgi:hypothetical protein